MERMLLGSASEMNRKAITLSIVLLLTWLAPATAIIGFCARMPCCAHAPADDAAAFSTERNDCCTSIACYESPSAKLSNRVATADLVFAAPALVVVAPATLPPALTAGVLVDTSPPATAPQRLAALSVLRI